MTNSQRLQVRLSEIRTRLNEIAGLEGDAFTDEIRAESDALGKEYAAKESQFRAAVIAEGEAEQRAEQDAPKDAEQRQRVELRSKARLTNYVMAALQGRMPSGAELELQQEAGVSGIPLELFDVGVERRIERRAEMRADMTTPAPATGTGVNVDPIRPLIYARAVLPRLGVMMPRVGSGGYATMTITTGLSAGAMAKDAARESTAAALTPQTTTPHRVSARLSVTMEDVATVGADNFEAALRQNLMLAMSDELDRLGLNGDGQAANPTGLLTRLADPADPTDVIDWNGFAAVAADGIDGGPWAETLQSVMLLVNPETQRLAERTFKDGTGFGGQLSAAAYLRANAGGFMASRRMPDTASTIAQAIRYRAGTMGLDGVNAVRTAVCPVWADMTIDDIYSDAASATRHLTMHNLIGDVILEQASAYEQVAFKLA